VKQTQILEPRGASIWKALALAAVVLGIVMVGVVFFIYFGMYILFAWLGWTL
jgi:hypothetical protein